MTPRFYIGEYVMVRDMPLTRLIVLQYDADNPAVVWIAFSVTACGMTLRIRRFSRYLECVASRTTPRTRAALSEFLYCYSR